MFPKEVGIAIAVTILAIPIIVPILEKFVWKNLSKKGRDNLLGCALPFAVITAIMLPLLGIGVVVFHVFSTYTLETVLAYSFFGLLAIITGPMLLASSLAFAGGADDDSLKPAFAFTWALIATLFFFAATFDMESGFYFILRLSMSMTMLGVLIFEKHIFKLIPLFFLVLYNPIVPVYLHDKELWLNWNIAAGACLWLSFIRFFYLYQKQKAKHESA